MGEIILRGEYNSPIGNLAVPRSVDLPLKSRREEARGTEGNEDIEPADLEIFSARTQLPLSIKVALSTAQD